jgi:dimethylglycine dehydrogenase
MSLRLEKAFPSWGLDLTSDYSPWATSLARFVRTGKGDFVGRDATLELQKSTDIERFVTLVVDADNADAVGGEAVYCDGEYAGYASSGGFGYAVGQSLALAYLKTDKVSVDARYEIEIVGQLRPARLITEPLYDPDGGRMRS